MKIQFYFFLFTCLIAGSFYFADAQTAPSVSQAATSTAAFIQPTGVPDQAAGATSTPTATAVVATTTSEKLILVSLKDEELTYFEGTTMMGQFKISSGVKGRPTPPGDYDILKKKPLVHYVGPGYDYPKTKWNLMFKRGKTLNYYIHGAYWHHNFGHPMSHGCINVSYADMEGLYNWADLGTKLEIY